MKNERKVYYCEEIPDQISQHSLAYLLLERMGRTGFPEIWPEQPSYARTVHGKPYLPECPQLYFNLSHCKEGIACALGTSPVGIDIERRFAWKEPLERRICHPKERELLEKLEPEERSALLNLIWGRKESFLKCIGTGIRRDLRELNVLEEAPYLQDEDGKLHRYCFSGFQTERFTLVVCTHQPEGSDSCTSGDRPDQEVTFRRITLPEIL